MAKQQIPKENKSSSELQLSAKYIGGGNVTCSPSPAPSQLQNLSKKRYVLKREL